MQLIVERLQKNDKEITDVRKKLSRMGTDNFQTIGYNDMKSEVSGGKLSEL
jgi:hypothetical protein